MNPGTATELVMAAALFEDRAARLEATGDVLAATAATASWAGPAADRFRLLMVDRRHQLRNAATELRDVAHVMRLTSAGPA